MLIAIDYDGTYTEDPVMWDVFIAIAKTRGNKVICVTMRYEHEGVEVMQSIGSNTFIDGIYFTGRKAKCPYMSNLGIMPDIWIDDNPEWIYEDTT